MINFYNNFEQQFLNNSHSVEVSQLNKSLLLQTEEDKSAKPVKIEAQETYEANINNLQNRAELDVKNGSKTYGKFKDADTLFEAYNNLQSDYTKKCQNLSNLQKKLEEKEQTENSSPEQLLLQLENQSRSFFENNKQAEPYKEQIFKTLQEDKLLINTNNPFEQAWIKVLKENFVDKANLIKDPQFLQEYVFNNNYIKNKIISEYFAKLHTQENPTLISNQKGSQTVLATVSKPKTIEEASKLVEDLFN